MTTTVGGGHPRFQPRDLTSRHKLAAAAELEGVGLGRDHATHAHRQLLGKHVCRRIARGLAVDALGLRVGKEPEALQPAHEVLLDMHRAVLGDLGVKLVLLLQAAHERARAPVDEALGQLFVQGVRQAVLDGPGATLPVLVVGEPIDPVGDEGPGADVGDAVGERVDIPVRPVGQGHLLGKPVRGDALLRCHQELVERGHQLGMVLR
jgi:hypothetical protein